MIHAAIVIVIAVRLMTGEAIGADLPEGEVGLDRPNFDLPSQTQGE